MEFKGTKGEWKVEGLDIIDYTPVSITCDNKLIAEVYNCVDSFKPHTEESKANAQLIASAPDLLKALIEVTRESDCPPYIQAMAQQAINKAINK